MTTQNPANTPVFHVEKLFLKDLSFENPNGPDSIDASVEPKVEFNMQHGARRIGEDRYDVTLEITVRVNVVDRPLFLVEISYAGHFMIRNMPAEHLPLLLGIECPHILFPYVRQIISQTVVSGGFKPMILDPINFASLYHQAQAERKNNPPPTIQ